MRACTSTLNQFMLDKRSHQEVDQITWPGRQPDGRGWWLSASQAGARDTSFQPMNNPCADIHRPVVVVDELHRDGIRHRIVPPFNSYEYLMCSSR